VTQHITSSFTIPPAGNQQVDFFGDDVGTVAQWQANFILRLNSDLAGKQPLALQYLETRYTYTASANLFGNLSGNASFTADLLHPDEAVLELRAHFGGTDYVLVYSLTYSFPSSYVLTRDAARSSTTEGIWNQLFYNLQTHGGNWPDVVATFSGAVEVVPDRALRWSDKEISKAYVGSKAVSKIYLGQVQVWPPIPAVTFDATLGVAPATNGHTYTLHVGNIQGSRFTPYRAHFQYLPSGDTTWLDPEPTFRTLGGSNTQTYEFPAATNQMRVRLEDPTGRRFTDWKTLTPLTIASIVAKSVSTPAHSLRITWTMAGNGFTPVWWEIEVSGNNVATTTSWDTDTTHGARTNIARNENGDVFGFDASKVAVRMRARNADSSIYTPWLAVDTT